VEGSGLEAGEAPACAITAALEVMPGQATVGRLTDRTNSMTISIKPRDRLFLTVQLCREEGRHDVTMVTVTCVDEQILVITKALLMTRHWNRRAIVLVVAAVLALAIPQEKASAQVLNKCGDGVTMKLNSALTTQGTLLLAEVVAAKSLPEMKGEWGGRELALWKEGSSSRTLHGLLGIDLEKPAGKYDWTIFWKNKEGEAESCSETVTVRTGKFPTEKLKVEKQFVEPDPEQQKRAEEDQKKMKAIYETVTPERLWDGAFHLPLKDVTSGGNFGRRRILNGQARSPHAGVDFPAMKGTAVFAAQRGKVVLAEDLYYSGNTIVIDHGYGIYTLYAHLSEIDVKPGETVESSAEIGKVGATGRVTGPHLHWGLTVQHARVNGMGIVQKQP
jgi:murein DD-endopeptidase MepM/ murein hydrolase activator NlpD